MDISVAQKKKLLQYLAKGDEKYRKLEREVVRMEEAFSELMRNMPDEQQDVAWGFVCMSNELDTRLLEFACTCMEFKEEYRDRIARFGYRFS